MTRPNDKRMANRVGTIFASPALAFLLAFFLVLQGVAAAFPSYARPERGDEAGFAKAYAVCVQHAPGDHRHSPAHGCDASCCVLCQPRPLVDMAVVAFDRFTVPTAPSPPFLTAAYFFQAVVIPPAGWVDSWSSRAPPLFS